MVAHEVAGDVIEAEERLGHHGAAQTLRGSLRPNQTKSSRGTNTAANIARGVVLQDALTLVGASPSLEDVQLRRNIRASVENLRLEWKHRDKLSSSGLPRRSRLLLHGPPGCGKSITAAGFGAALGLPVYVVRFDAIVGSYLGQTAVHLRELFRFAESSPCLLLIDEIDALGRHRGDPLDVGELHRIVITLMQELEHVQPAGYIVATSNLPGQLDAALWRRFDLVVEFPRPDSRQRERFASLRSKALGVRLTAELRAQSRRASNYAEVEKLVLAEARRDLLARLERT